MKTEQGMYDNIRSKIMKNKSIFMVVHFFYTPIRVLRECYNRRKITNHVIEACIKNDNSKNNIFYFGIPEHNNMGDIAQTYCTLKFLEENYKGYNVVQIRTRAAFDSKLTKFINSMWKENDIIIFQSGYCTRHKNPDHLMHKRCAKIFPDKKMIVLPQTVMMKNKKDERETKKLFSNCKQLAFFARDKISYENARNFVSPDRLFCFPDIVTSLIGRLDFKRCEREGVLICVRNDEEKYYTDAQINRLMEDLKKVTTKVDIRDTNSKYSVEYTYMHLEDVVRQMATDFSKYCVVITDRYHGTIFSLIANTPVIVLKTNDHKVTSGVDWFEGRFDEKSVCIADNLESAEIMAERLIKNQVDLNNSDVLYKAYYEHKLKQIISGI